METTNVQRSPTHNSANGNNPDFAQPEELETIATLVRTTAQQYQGQSIKLLVLLRMIEALHQEIRDGLFQKALPENRQALYALLRDIEANGGWPYIHRMKLRAFLANLIEDAEETNPPSLK
jgi:hypothetical protein